MNMSLQAQCSTGITGMVPSPEFHDAARGQPLHTVFMSAAFAGRVVTLLRSSPAVRLAVATKASRRVSLTALGEACTGNLSNTRMRCIGTGMSDNVPSSEPHLVP